MIKIAIVSIIAIVVFFTCVRLMNVVLSGIVTIAVLTIAMFIIANYFVDEMSINITNEAKISLTKRSEIVINIRDKDIIKVPILKIKELSLNKRKGTESTSDTMLDNYKDNTVLYVKYMDGDEEKEYELDLVSISEEGYEKFKFLLETIRKLKETQVGNNLISIYC